MKNTLRSRLAFFLKPTPTETVPICYQVSCDHTTPTGVQFCFLGETNNVDYALDLKALVQRRLPDALVRVRDSHGDVIG